MNGQFEDILGQSIRVGDEVAVAFPSGNAARLRVGTILGIFERPTEIWNHNLRAYFPGPPTHSIEVKWDQKRSGTGVPDKPTKLSETQGRVLKL